MAPKAHLVFCFLSLLLTWSAASTVYLEGSGSIGTTNIYDGSALTVISRGTQARSSSQMMGTFTANSGYTYSRYLTLTFSDDSYISDPSVTISVYDGSNAYAGTLAQYVGSSNRKLLALVSTQYQMYIVINVGSSSGLDFYLKMKLTPVKATYTDKFNGGTYHGYTNVYDYEKQTIVAAGSMLSYLPASDYSTYYADSGYSSDHYFDISFSPDSYIGTSLMTVFIRDGSSNYSKPLATYRSSSSLHSVSTTQYAAYVNVVVHSGSSKDYFLRMTLTPKNKTYTLPGLTIGLSVGISSLVLFIIIVISLVVVRKRRLTIRSGPPVTVSPGYPNVQTATVGGTVVPPPAYPSTQGYPAATSYPAPAATSYPAPTTAAAYPTTAGGPPPTYTYNQ